MTRRKLSYVLLILGFLLFFSLGYHFITPAYTAPYVLAYYPSSYNLLGQTGYVSGDLGGLTSDNGVYMTFRSYGTSSTQSIRAMVTYGEGTVNIPRYQLWNGTVWSAEASASATSSTIQWTVLKSGPTRNEKILGTLASTGGIHVQVWNGASWSAAQSLGGGVGTTNDAYRAFDIAYEQTSGRAVVVFVPSSIAVDPQFIVWNGSSWSTPTTIDIPTTGGVRWIKLASRLGSNQIALMTLDANSDIAGIIWNGTTWGNARTLTTTASTATRECFAVEYEQQSGYAMFVWGEIATDLYYWRWNGSAWVGAAKTLLDLPAQGGTSNWIMLKADPNSNRLMLGVQDSGSDLNTRQWSGTAWDTATEHPEHDSTVENVASRNFDIEYETFSGHAGHAILVWGDGSTASWKHWTPTTGASGWSTSQILTGSDDTAVTQLRCNSNGMIFAMLLEDPTSNLDDFAQYRWDGNAWSSRLIIEGSPSMTVQPMMEPFMVAPDRHMASTEWTVEVEFMGSSNTESWTQLVWTLDSAWTTGNVAVTLQLYNYTLGNYPTSGNGYISYVSSATANTDETRSQTITINPVHFRDSSGNWRIKVRGVKSTSTQFDFKADFVKFETTHVDSQPPMSSNAGTNNTNAGQPTLFHVRWTDNYGLSGFIFGTNNTGRWVNDTWTPMSGVVNWSNVTKVLNSTARTVQWRVWANDTSNNWNNTGILSLTITYYPVASFTFTPSTPYTSDTVTFNASTSYDLDGSIVSYLWTFGDGVNGTGIVATHAYSNNAVYSVTLKVTDNNGFTDTETKSVTVLNRPPIASFTESATTVPTGTVIYFNASASYDPDGTIVNYRWNFGDGTNATGITASHAYADDGVYNVTLTVTDNDGGIDTETATKTILNRAPVASFTESATTVYTGEIIHFNASASYDPDGSIVSYFWSFGDGINATGVTTSHSYANQGVYNVTLTITDDDSAQANSTATKTVLNSPPIAQFTESAETIYTGETITFNASSSHDSDGTIVSYFWTFGDGTNTTGVVVSHAYSENGIYIVTLKVTDNEGATASANATKTVLNRPPIVSFTTSATTVYTSQTITFNASASYDPDGSLISYRWNFGDGNITTTTTPIITHTYPNNGIYNVTLTVTDNDSGTASASVAITVLNRSPIASFVEDKHTVLTLEPIQFNASGSYDLDGSIASYRWDFGDGNITTTSSPFIAHAYSNNGVYIVTLTVTDDDGATSTANDSKTVINRQPVASFTESATTVYTGEIIYFNASSSYDLDGTIVNYFWTFGDGTNATGITVSHAYSARGNYTVTLVVTDDDGATASANATKTVVNRPPVASFTESATTVYTNEIIYFNASASYDLDGSIVSYFWTFGDGTNATGVFVSHAYPENGVYLVTLTVTDNDGAISISTASKTVLNRLPIASFTVSATTVYTSEVVTFNATASYDPDGTIVSYRWNFGDGNITTVATPIITHKYAQNGTYTVTLTVTDNDGGTSSNSITETVLNRLPVASFVEDKHVVYTLEVVHFDASASYDPDGTIVSYRWNFGDGNITTTSSPLITHSYLNNGIYTVTLTITDDDGAISIATDTKTVLNRLPFASFTESATTVYTGEVIYFNASASYDLDGSIVIYFWSFGDGTNATGVTVSHAYSTRGTYVVTLTVTDDDGGTASANATKAVLNRAPVASFTASATTVETGEVVYFNASASYDPDGSIISYFWSFGDGTNATGIMVSHAFASRGLHNVTLTVTDNDGAKATAFVLITVSNRLPVASFTESATTVLTREVIYFNASGSHDPDGTIVSYVWDFGDGNITTVTVPTISHAYANNGTYTVTLTVRDNDGGTASISAVKTVLNRPPVASFVEDKHVVLTLETISFNASASYDLDGTIVSYRWDFGDGNITTTSSPFITHRYLNDGIYTVTLTVTDDDGTTATDSDVKTVLNRLPVASFTESATTAYTGEVIYFNASSSYDLDGSIVSYFWTFGDGTNATGMFVSHAYVENGNYTVTLTVTDNDGATASRTEIKTILNRPPLASFTESATTVYTSEVIFFNASASYDPDGLIVSYFWSFGDGTNATGITASHAYVENGIYNVTLTVTDNDGAKTTVAKLITVLNRSPVANFTESSTSVLTGETIYFNASASYDPDGTIADYFWTFGDGTNATGMIVSHAYVDNGMFTVTLTVRDNDGGTASTSTTVTVSNRPPVASFTESATTVYTDEPISFNASGSYDLDGSIVSYFWDFGDGTNATGMIVSHAYVEDGTYTVVLTVRDNDGAVATTSAVKTVLNRLPVASFTESTTMVLTGEVVYFNASTSYDPDGSIVSYFWDFGDGTNATGITTSHAYTQNGVFTVTLTVTDDDNAQTTATENIYVDNRPPVASFTYSPSFPIEGQTATFNASASYDPDGPVVSYRWDFGDGNITTVTSPIITHVYVAYGNYTVALTVTDSDGATGTTSHTVKVRDYPTATFTYSPSSPTTGQTVTFNASSSLPNGGVVTNYVWNFGDGTPEVNMTSPIVTHVFSVFGNYTVTLTVKDSEGLTGITVRIITIRGYPSASFTFSPSYPIERESVTFDASSSTPNGGIITTYQWNFGDGNITTVTTPIITHVYSSIGNYTVTLTVTDNEGLSNSQSQSVSIRGYPVAHFTFTPSSPYVGDTVTFNASLSTPNGGAIINYQWNFGDGTPSLNTTSPMVTHVYSVAGNYTVTLTIRDSEGLIDTETHSVIIAQSPVALFTHSPEFPRIGETVTFNASGSYDVNGYVVSYRWDFGDGNITTVTSPLITHVYSSTGVYAVALTVTDNSGYTDTTTRAVTLGTPKAAFTHTPQNPISGQSIIFNASSSFDPNGYIVSYVWNFGDGNVTTTASPIITHVYQISGNYTVALTVADNQGLTDTTAHIVQVGKSPEADFTHTPASPYLGDTVTFNASISTPSSGVITNYVWNFGDGSPIVNTTSPIATHTYTVAGTYSVSLTIKDSVGLTNTVTKTVNIMQSPVAIFTHSPTYPQALDTVTFNASASYDANGYIVSYVWNFGDGNITTVTNPIITHVYPVAGNYTVVLIVSDNEGRTHSMTKIMYISLRPPVATFTSTPAFPITGQSVTFDASGSYDLDGSIVSYTWNFGDGNVTTTVNPIITHKYSAAGNYTVSLTVKDNDNLTTVEEKTVRIRDYPTAAFTYSPAIPGEGDTVTFNASSSTPNGGVIVSYLWNFGDGSPALNTTNPIVTHVFATSGNYIITLTVSDSEALSDVETKTVYIARLPVASFTYSPSTPYVGDTVTFNASASYDPDGTIVRYRWDFGDGSQPINTTIPTTTHVYTINGNYIVTLTVTDNQGFQATTTRQVNVGKAPVAAFTYSPSYPIANQSVTFDASTSHDARRPITSYRWNFGDGNITTVTSPVVTHVYAAVGNYTVVLTVTDSGGYSDTITQSVKVRSYPIASFTYSPSYPIKGQNVTFDASASQPIGGVIVSYLWNFGDGTPAVNTTSAVAVHVYTVVGQYTVTLTVKDSEGLTSVVTKSVKIRDYPTADFTWFPASPTATYSVTFNASLSRANSGTITGYIWNFGDGNFTTVTTPIISHVFATARSYAVTLTVANSEGLSSSTTKTVTVLNALPVASFTYSPSFPVTNQTVTFDASASYDRDGSIVSYRWDFGDGNITTVTTPLIYHKYTSYGSKTVTLTITDNDGQTSSQVKTVTIGQPPIPSFTYSPSAPYVGDSVIFNASQSYDPNGFIVKYSWNFGDGSPVYNTTSTTASHSYSVGGSYVVTLTIFDNEGFPATTSRTVVVAKAPAASFTYSPTSPIAGTAATFDASGSTDARRTIVKYVWLFGDGAQTNTTTPVVTYVYPREGDYTVTLTVIDSGGYRDTTTRTIRIRNYPVPSFNVSPASPIKGQVASFNASSSQPKGGVITSYLWDFGDGTPKVNTTSPIITHTYAARGSYVVNLTVADSEGLTGLLSKSIAVREYPTASFTNTVPIQRNLPANFNASASTPNGGVIISYRWDFGDGNITTVTYSVIAHKYSNTGLFTVRLTVTDSEGLNHTLSRSVFVVPAYPIASFTYTPQTPLVGGTVTFNASSSYDPDGMIVIYRWNFGDGMTVNVTTHVTTHAYTAAGTYNVTLTVKDIDGYSTSVSKMVTVSAYPNAFFEYSPFYAQVGVPTLFNASKSTPGSGVITSYTWNFGDGNITTTANPIIYHVYSNSGSYQVVLTVINSGGLSDDYSRTVSVYGIPIASFTWTPTTPLTQQTVTFNASASQPNGGYIANYIWDFGDGTTPVDNLRNPVITHQFSTYGTFTVTLRVKNSAGLVGTISRSITVISPPTPRFTWAPTAPYAYDIVIFDARTSSAGSSSIVSYSWNFGDGNTTSTSNPVISHKYLSGGDRTVTLTISNSAGLSNSTSKTVSVASAAAPYVDFTYSPSTPKVYQRITFDASASVAHGGILVSYRWNFGDGNITTVTVPIIYHTYQSAGNYTVTLQVTNSAGYSSSAPKTVQVGPIANPTASFTWSPTVPQTNQTITFNAAASTPGWNGSTYPPIIYYVWNFGDGNITSTTNPVIYHKYSSRGNYTVTMTVMDAQGRTDDITHTLSVSGLIGDFNGDGKIDMKDISRVAKHFGEKVGDPTWDPVCDINGDGKIDMKDISYVAKNFGQHL